MTSLSCIGEGNGNPLQCPYLENPRDGGAWWAAVYGVAQSWTRLKRLSSSSKSCLTLCDPWTEARQAPLSLKFSRKNAGVGSHSLLQGIFPTQGLNPRLQHYRQILYHLSHQDGLMSKLSLLYCIRVLLLLSHFSHVRLCVTS